MLVLLHLLEVVVWALFYLWTNAVNSPDANASLAYYFALMEYTTIGSAYNLKLDWRLLEGMNGIAGPADLRLVDRRAADAGRGVPAAAAGRRRGRGGRRGSDS